MQQTAVAANQGLLLQGDPNVGWIALQRLTEKSRGRNADHCKGMALDHERCAHDRWIAAVGVLPDAVAQHGDRRSRGLIVLRSEDAAAEGGHPERRKITPGDVFRL